MSSIKPTNLSIGITECTLVGEYVHHVIPARKEDPWGTHTRVLLRGFRDPKRAH